MSDGLDLNQPLPDRAHEAIRVAVLQAIAGVETGQADTSDSLYLVDVLFELLDGLTVTVEQLRADLDAITPPAP